MTSGPLVSVIVPCRDARRTVDETLDSALSQRGVRPEIIVVDDGSTDGTLERLLRLGGRIRLIRGAGLGPAAARNLGTDASSGELLQYLDADDRLRPDTLVRRAEALEAASADAVYCDWQVFVETKNALRPGEIRRPRLEGFHPVPEIAVFSGFWVPPAAILYRRSITRLAGRWNESLPVGEDARFLFDVARAGARFACAPHVGADYRVRPGSLSRKDPGLFFRSLLANADQVRALWTSPAPDPDRLAALLRVYAYIARASYDVDRRVHERARAAWRELDPAYLPEGSAVFRRLSAWAGYERAEAVAGAVRKIKRFCRIVSGGTKR